VLVVVHNHIFYGKNGVYLNGKLNKKFSQEAKKTILIFNSLGYKLLKENYSIAKG
jgi:hypothetical protein